MKGKKKIPGTVINNWTLIEYNSEHKKWLCKCTCGNEKLLFTSSLIRKSTGCNKCVVSHKTHGMINSTEYKSWNHMKYRCLNKNSHKYPLYGGRGIKVCTRWLNSFENFYEDMGPKPAKNCTIDRIDPNGDYESSNCKWSTPLEQGRNLRTAIVYEGEKHSLLSLCRKYSIAESTVRNRLKRGWSLEDALNKPIYKKCG